MAIVGSPRGTTG